MHLHFSIKKVISVFLTMTMMFTLFGVPVFATEMIEQESEITEMYDETIIEENNSAAQLMSSNEMSLMSSGTTYYITTAEELDDVRNDLAGTYYLMNDINLSSYGDWVPIGHSNTAFTGVFNGQGHKVTGMTVNNSEYDNTGLFGRVSGTIINLGVSGTIVTTNNNVGMLAGYATVGANIKNCYTTGSIEANENVGGLIGYTYSYSNSRTNPVNIENCYSKVAVTGLKAGTSDYLGGLVGKDYSSGDITVIKRCYATGYIKTKNDSAKYGGILGGCTGSSCTLLFCYYDKYVVQAIDTDKGFAATTAQMKTQSIFTGWDFDNIWGIDANVNNGYPYLKFGEYEYENEGSGSKSDPYMIYSQEDLIAVTEGKIGKSGSYYELANDIVLDAVFWTPIGGNLSNIDFAGYFDGAGHTISGLNITQDNFTYNGLFGEVCGRITNLAVDGNISISNNNVGMLAGYATVGANIKNCYTTGSIEANQNVGGLIGYTYSYSNSRTNPVNIENCYSKVAVTGFEAGTSDYLGGLVGKDYSSGDITVIKCCYATGNISSKNPSAKNIGGVFGGSQGTSAEITACYYDQSSTGMSDTGKGIPLSVSEMQSQGTFVIWDFDTVWAISSNINNGYPYLQALIPNDTTPVTGILLNKTSVILNIGDNEILAATVLPNNATNKNVDWSSSNNNIATVSNGKVTAKSIGTAVITATTADGGYTASCTVTVKADSSAVIGDANGDGEIDFTDAIVVLKHDAGLSALTGDKLTSADANGDGEIDFVDAILILKYDSGLISSFN